MDTQTLSKILEDHKLWLDSLGNYGKIANLSYANLSGADLSGADLSDANLSYAYLSGANLSRANLRDANLRDANLGCADLRGAGLTGANLKGSGLKIYQSDFYTAYISLTHISIGCKFYTVKEWKAFTDEEIDKMEDGKSLAYWKANKDVIFSIVESLKLDG